MPAPGMKSATLMKALRAAHLLTSRAVATSRQNAKFAAHEMSFSVASSNTFAMRSTSASRSVDTASFTYWPSFEGK